MFDAVWLRVVGRIADSVHGTLHDHQAWRVAGHSFPGLCPAPGHAVAGRIWLGLQPDEIRRLDAYESAMYFRQPVRVTNSTGRMVTCETYVVREACRVDLLPEPWDRTTFERCHLHEYLARESAHFPAADHSGGNQ